MRKSNTNGEKLYYSISEVSKIIGLEPYVMRYWEKEFPTLRPKKSRGGNRVYTQKDIEMLNQINHLRTREKLTIAGARTRLMMKRPSEQKDVVVASAKVKTLIGQIKEDIERLLEELS
jgi:DNA-binding transcriptional MerR regulator